MPDLSNINWVAQNIVQAAPTIVALRPELIWRNRWNTRRQAEGAIFQYINGFSNPRHRHSSLGGKSPLEFKRKAA